MRKLLSSIIQGKTLGCADVLVTSRPGGIKDTSCFDKTAEIYGLTQDNIFEYISLSISQSSAEVHDKDFKDKHGRPHHKKHKYSLDVLYNGTV